MRVTSKGQVTIPVEVRERLSIHPEDEVEFVVEGDRAFLRKKEGASGRGARLVQRLRGRGTVRMGTDEIMALTRGED